MAQPVRHGGAKGLITAGDTIFAIATGAGAAAIAIMRVSGPAACAAGHAIAGGLPAARVAGLRRLRTAAGDTIDQALVLWFAAGASATGEDLVEFHIHGGPAVAAALGEALRALPGLRDAEAGEFTRRAFLNGRIDLTQAEGLGALLRAETDEERRGALDMVEGHLSQRIETWRARTLQLSARAEAIIEFADEDDVDESDGVALTEDIAALAVELAEVVAQPAIESLRGGPVIVLAGPANAGKSTLFNALVGRDAAIVSPVSGTTRDRIEATVHRNGRAFTFVDTAGLRETDDQIERIGIGRAEAAVAAADMVLWLGDDPPTVGGVVRHVWARCDMPDRSTPVRGALPVSAATGVGMSGLWEAIEASVTTPAARALTIRQRSVIADVAGRLAERTDDPLLQAEGLRTARYHFDRVTGRAGVEDLLDTIFAGFCIGK